MDLTKLLKVVTDAWSQFAFTLQILKFSKEHGPWNKTYNSENRKKIELCIAKVCNVVW